MGDTKTNDIGVKPCCKEDQKQEKKLVKATELPIHGTPFPPQDVIINERPSILESGVRDLRNSLGNLLSPIAPLYERTNHVVETGYAHTSSLVHRLSESESPVVHAAIITSAGLLGLGLARKRGFLSKLLFGSVFIGGAAAACYPTIVGEKAQLLWYIGKNKLPGVAAQQYEKLIGKVATEKEPKEQQQNSEDPKV